eukprot:UN08155
MGSITLLDSTFNPTYRASKAALNAYVKALSIDYPEINFIPIHPGHVKSDMGNSFGIVPPVNPDESVSGMLKQFNDFCYKEASGQKMYVFDGTQLPW